MMPDEHPVVEHEYSWYIIFFQEPQDITEVQ